MRPSVENPAGDAGAGGAGGEAMQKTIVFFPRILYIYKRNDTMETKMYRIENLNGDLLASDRIKQGFATTARARFRHWITAGEVVLVHQTARGRIILDPDELFAWLEDAEQAEYEKKSATHRQVTIRPGASIFAPTKTLWIRKK